MIDDDTPLLGFRESRPGSEPASDDHTGTTGTDASPEGGDEGAPPQPPDELPVLPLVGRVVFPGTVVPIPIVRERSKHLLESVLPDQRTVALVTQRDEDEETPGPEDLYETGVEARVLRIINQGEAPTLLIVQALHRIRLGDFTQTDPFLRARVERIESSEPARTDRHWEAAIRNLRDAAVELIGFNPQIPDEAKNALAGIDDPALLTDVVAGNLGIEVEERQKLLETADVVRRLEALQRILNEQIEIGRIQQKLRDDVQSELSDSQRRAYLREQMRAIQRELGEGDGTGEQIDELRRKLEEAGLPEEVLKEAERELGRLEAIPNASPEYSVIVSYLETIAELPWSRLSEDNLDLDKAAAILDRDHFGLDKVKRRLIEYLAVRKLNPHGQGPILCLLGPPGVGKTSLGHSIADALGRRFARLALGGIRDEAEIRGHRRTYVGAMPGRLIQELRRVGTRNPVIMLDEIDKVGADFRGDPASALLEVLDPRQNQAFVDRYLDVPFDLSQVIFIATANVIDPVPPALKDRMEVISIAGYTDREKREIARRYLVPRQLAENGLREDQCRWTDAAVELLIDRYTREAGVRNLEREIGAVCRWVAARVARGESDTVEIDAARVAEALGAARFVRESKLRSERPGVVTGLAWTPVGGEVLHIEAVRFPGKGHAKLTGQLGDVMKESVSIAHSVVRARAPELGIAPGDFETFDVHVHVPAGAVPKDGPSAGIAMFTSIASLFADRSVRTDTAMTGELTLRGLVLPVGGIKEKLLAAHRAGIERALIPLLNEKDLEEVPAEVRDQLEIVPVEFVEQVLEHALTTDGGDAGAAAPAP